MLRSAWYCYAAQRYAKQSLAGSTIKNQLSSWAALRGEARVFTSYNYSLFYTVAYIASASRCVMQSSAGND